MAEVKERSLGWSVYFFLVFSLACGVKEGAMYESGTDWPSYQGDVYRNQYSPLDQISKSNVSNLKVAWPVAAS